MIVVYVGEKEDLRFPSAQDFPDSFRIEPACARIPGFKKDRLFSVKQITGRRGKAGHIQVLRHEPRFSKRHSPSLFKKMLTKYSRSPDVRQARTWR
jgi:hypothetical protein